MWGLPASEVKYTVNKFNNMLKAYDNLKKNELRNNFSEFLKEIVPVAEEHNVKMALHPDDPPIPLFGLPRIVSTLDDYNYIFNQYDSKSNGIECFDNGWCVVSRWGWTDIIWDGVMFGYNYSTNQEQYHISWWFVVYMNIWS